MLCMCCGILTTCRGSLYWSWQRLGDNVEGVNTGWLNQAKFSWENKCWEEFKVNISYELIWMDEESIRALISIPIL